MCSVSVVFDNTIPILADICFHCNIKLHFVRRLFICLQEILPNADKEVNITE